MITLQAPAGDDVYIDCRRHLTAKEWTPVWSFTPRNKKKAELLPPPPDKPNLPDARTHELRSTGNCELFNPAFTPWDVRRSTYSFLLLSAPPYIHVDSLFKWCTTHRRFTCDLGAFLECCIVFRARTRSRGR